MDTNRLMTGMDISSITRCNFFVLRHLELSRSEQSLWDIECTSLYNLLIVLSIVETWFMPQRGGEILQIFIVSFGCIERMGVRVQRGRGQEVIMDVPPEDQAPWLSPVPE